MEQQVNRVSVQPLILRESPSKIPTWQPAPRRATAPRILVIDDDSSARSTMAATLRRCGCHVVESDSVIDGMAIARSRHFDGIVLDVVSDGLEGWNALMMLTSESKAASTKVIVATTHDDSSSILKAGALACIWKPVSRIELVGALRMADILDARSVVLAVDADPFALATYERLLAPWGYCVTRIPEASGITRATDVSGAGVVLLDVASGLLPATRALEDLRARSMPAVVIVPSRDVAREILRQNSHVEVVVRCDRADAFAADIAHALDRVTHGMIP